MNLIKSFLFLVSFLMISSVPFSQEVCYLNYEGNGQYAEEKDTFLSTGIASDFGPRKIGDFWHGGVDYNSSGGDAWDLILSPENVTIVDVNRLIRSGGGIRYLTLDAGDHRYLPVHMFDDNNSVPRWMNNETIYLTKPLGTANLNKWALIMIVGQDTTALGQVEGYAEINGDTIEITNSIRQYEPIGPLGDSGTGQPHLHLNTISDNQSFYNSDDSGHHNPLQYVNYITPAYSTNLISNRDISGEGLSYTRHEVVWA